MEVSCGEGPYLVSRYDTVTGLPIPIHYRIGLLDRKLRIVSENTDNTCDWLKMAQKAFMSTYGFEWQGDNLLLAREALFFTFIDYYKDKFGKLPQEASMDYIAYIISWNNADWKSFYKEFYKKEEEEDFPCMKADDPNSYSKFDVFLKGIELWLEQKGLKMDYKEENNPM